MRVRAVARLIRAELSLGRRAAIVYAILAAAGTALVTAPGDMARGLGRSLVMAVLIGQCFHLPIVTVFQDATMGTRAFTLSLPITPADYAAAKLFANMLLFLVRAGAAATCAILLPAEHRLFSPALVVLMLLGWLVFFVQNLGIAMLTESTGVTIGLLLSELFVVGNGGMNVAPRLPGMLRIWGQLEGGGPARTIAFAIMLAELVGLVALILFLMNRKRRFL